MYTINCICATYQILPLVVVELSVLKHFDVVLLHQQPTVLDDQQRATDSAGVGVNPDFSISDVSDHRDFGVDDVHLTSQLSKRQHQLLGIAMDADLKFKQS